MLNRKTLSPEFSTPACHHGCFSPGCPSSSPWSPETQKQEHLGADPSLFLTLKPTQVPHLPPGLPPFVAIVTTDSLHLPLTGCNPGFLLETWLFTENLPVPCPPGSPSPFLNHSALLSHPMPLSAQTLPPPKFTQLLGDLDSPILFSLLPTPSGPKAQPP